jgi:hypothetical protein
MNSTWIVTLAALILSMAACQPAPSTIVPASPTDSGALQEPAPSPEAEQPLLKTEMGDFAIASARIVDDVNGEEPQTGEKILVVTLAQPDLTNLDPSSFSLEDFSNMTHDPETEIYILGNDGSRTISTMGGWVEDEFAMGFRVPAEITTYTLHWTGNSPITLHVEE